MGLEIYLLGQFKLSANTIPFELPSRSAQSLMAYLALTSGATHRRETLAGLLWQDATETNARSYLRLALWRIRKSLDCAGLSWNDYLQISDISVTFNNLSEYWLDVDVFLKSTDELSVGEFIEAIRLYRGELLPGFYDEWISLERDRLEAAFYQKMNSLLDWLIQADKWEETLRWGEHWISHGHSPEPAYRALMRAHAGLGNPAMITATFERCVDSLDRDLSLEPSAETKRLYENLCKGEIGRSKATKTDLQKDAERQPLFFDVNLPQQIEKPLFVTREPELNRLSQFLDLAISGRGVVAFVTGEAGSGKTALINEFTFQAQEAHEDVIVAYGYCNANTGIGDPYLPFREILELLTGDVESRWSAGAITEKHARFLWNMIPRATQALVEAGHDLIDTFVSGANIFKRGLMYTQEEAEWLNRLDELLKQKASNPTLRNPQQIDLFNQYSKVLQILSRNNPLILVLDDLQWSDLGSISLLFHLGRNLLGSRILILGAYRPEEIALGRGVNRHPLESVINELKREYGEIIIDVDQAKDRVFVEEILDSEPNRLDISFRDMLYRQTQGQPLFTIELLRGMQERGDLLYDIDGGWVEGPSLDWEMLPARVEAVVAERINRMEKSLQDALRIASIEGELFTAEVVARVLALSPVDVRDRLSGELDKRHRLIQAHSIQRSTDRLISVYRFKHIVMQKYLYNSLDEVQRVYLHEQVGNALEEMYGNQEGATNIAPQLARHFQEAQIANKAIHYRLKAAERALQLSAHQEAIDHLEKGLKIHNSLAESEKEVQNEISLQLNLGVAWNFLGSPTPEVQKANIRARELSQMAGKTTQQCQALSGLSIYHYVRGEYSKGYELAEKVVQLGVELNESQIVALGNWNLGIISFARGDFSRANAQLKQITSNYAPQTDHRSYVNLRGVDPGLSARAYEACILWCLGYPEQAYERSQETINLSYEFNHYFTHADVLCYAGCHFNKIRQDMAALKKYAEEVMRISNQQEFSGWYATGMAFLGEALISEGKIEEGIGLINKGLDIYKSMGVNIYKTGTYIALAEGYAQLGNPEHGLNLLTEGLKLVEEGGEHHWEAELYRKRSKLQISCGDFDRAEISLVNALETAQSQETRSWELRAAIDLANIWREQGRSEEAQKILFDIYSWFTEGFDTPDLKKAKVLLDSLA
jgi:DNA-binding SARP family transcriptional activator/tetratricopeptide (TPR) repeat protein